MLFSRLSLCRGQRKGSPPLFWGRVALFTGARFPSSRKNSVALPTLNPFQVTLLGTRRRKTTGSVQAGASCSWRVCVDGREPATIYRRQPDLSVLQKCITLLATPAPNMCSTWRSYGLVMSLPWLETRCKGARFRSAQRSGHLHSRTVHRMTVIRSRRECHVRPTASAAFGRGAGKQPWRATAWCCVGEAAQAVRNRTSDLYTTEAYHHLLHSSAQLCGKNK